MHILVIFSTQSYYTAARILIFFNQDGDFCFYRQNRLTIFKDTFHPAHSSRRFRGAGNACSNYFTIFPNHAIIP